MEYRGYTPDEVNKDKKKNIVYICLVMLPVLLGLFLFVAAIVQVASVRIENASEVSYDELTFDGCDANSAYLLLEAFCLVEALEAGELSGELKAIAEGLKEDDNPVLMVVKFKE